MRPGFRNHTPTTFPWIRDLSQPPCIPPGYLFPDTYQRLVELYYQHADDIFTLEGRWDSSADVRVCIKHRHSIVEHPMTTDSKLDHLYTWMPGTPIAEKTYYYFRIAPRSPWIWPRRRDRLLGSAQRPFSVEPVGLGTAAIICPTLYATRIFREEGTVEASLQPEHVRVPPQVVIVRTRNAKAVERIRVGFVRNDVDSFGCSSFALSGLDPRAAALPQELADPTSCDTQDWYEMRNGEENELTFSVEWTSFDVHIRHTCTLKFMLYIPESDDPEVIGFSGWHINYLSFRFTEAN